MSGPASIQSKGDENLDFLRILESRCLGHKGKSQGLCSRIINRDRLVQARRSEDETSPSEHRTSCFACERASQSAFLVSCRIMPGRREPITYFLRRVSVKPLLPTSATRLETLRQPSRDPASLPPKPPRERARDRVSRQVQPRPAATTHRG
jgi:hypothetical protein